MYEQKPLIKQNIEDKGKTSYKTKVTYIKVHFHYTKDTTKVRTKDQTYINMQSYTIFTVSINQIVDSGTVHIY